MKANEFVKKYGFEEAQRVVRKAEEGATIYVLGNVPFYDDSTLSDHVVLDDLRHFVKACEFIKKFGWGTSKFCLDNCLSPNDKWFMHEGESIYDENFDELKRLVESHELVQSKGGLKKAKEILQSFVESCKYGGLENVREDLRSLKKAIADVEACNA